MCVLTVVYIVVDYESGRLEYGCSWKFIKILTES